VSEPVVAKKDQRERPEHEDPVGVEDPDLVEQQYESQRQDDHTNDEVPVGVAQIYQAHSP